MVELMNRRFNGRTQVQPPREERMKRIAIALMLTAVVAGACAKKQVPVPRQRRRQPIRQARSRRPDLRFLLITGHAGISNTDITGIPLLRKPFTPSKLAEYVVALSGHALP